MDAAEQAALATAAPFPIGGPYRLFRQESQPASGVNRLFDVAEAALRYMACCVAGELPRTPEIGRLDAWFEKPLSMGAVHGWTRETLKAVNGNDGTPFIHALKPLYLEKTGGNSVAGLFDEMITERNRTRGHGITPSDREYRRLRQKLSPTLDLILQRLAPAFAFSPVIVKGINDFDGRWHEHQVLRAVGDNPYFPVDTLNSDIPLPFRRVYLLGSDRSLTPLYPLLRYAVCGLCDEEHLFLFQSFHRNKSLYLDPFRGCSLEVPATVGEFRETLHKGSRQTLTLGTGGEPLKADLSSGFLLAGRYEIASEIGRGGGGQVFEALDTLTGQRVAVKTLKGADPHATPPAGSDPKVMIRRFQREAQVVSRLNHPSLVKVFDVGVDRGIHYFAMERVEGAELRGKLCQGPLPLDDIVSVASQLLGALTVAHAAGVVHRDIKPENILVQADGTAKLADFGVARLSGATALTSSGEIVGTVGYMSPEQVEGEAVDPRSDLFSLGVLLHEMSTGASPFLAPTVQETLAAVLKRTPPPPSALNAEIPPWFDALVESLLRKSRDGRPPDAQAVLAVLSRGPEGKAKKAQSRLLPAWLSPRPEPDLDYIHPIEAEGIHLSFGRKKRVLRGLDLSLPKGTRYCLLGRNGSGKTTLIRCLMRAYHPDRGRLCLFGTPRAARHRINRHIGYIPETPTAYPYMRLGHFLSYLGEIYPTWNRGFILELLGHYGFNPEEKIGAMSRGMKTMVSVLAAFGHRPPLLVFDDPTLGLDAFWVQDFLKTVGELTAARGTTVLFTTHNFEAVEAIADRVGFLLEGRIAFEIDLQEIPRRFCSLSLVLPDDEDPKRWPEGFTVLEKRKRSVSGVYQLRGEKPEAAFTLVKPATLEASPATLKDVYFHILTSRGAERTDGY